METNVSRVHLSPSTTHAFCIFGSVGAGAFDYNTQSGYGRQKSMTPFTYYYDFDSNQLLVPDANIIQLLNATILKVKLDVVLNEINM